MVEQSMTITSEDGVHARPATVLVQTAGQYEADVYFEYNGKSVNIKSIMGIMSLGIPSGAEVNITAEGSDEEEALQAVAESMKKENLGE